MIDLEEMKMYAKLNFPMQILIFALLGILLLTGCGVVPGVPGIVPSVTDVPQEPLPIISPESARDVVLAYIRTYHPGVGPSEDAFWFEETEPTENMVGSSSFTYRYEAWTVTVTFPVVAPDATIYTVTVEHASPKIYWQGLVDAYAQVVETSFI
jgi:hypothetical protein